MFIRSELVEFAEMLTQQEPATAQVLQTAIDRVRFDTSGETQACAAAELMRCLKETCRNTDSQAGVIFDKLQAWHSSRPLDAASLRAMAMGMRTGGISATPPRRCDPEHVEKVDDPVVG